MCVSQDHLAALMEVNEENETLMKQYDREKQRRKEIEEVKYTCDYITSSVYNSMFLYTTSIIQVNL